MGSGSWQWDEHIDERVYIRSNGWYLNADETLRIFERHIIAAQQKNKNKQGYTVWETLKFELLKDHIDEEGVITSEEMRSFWRQWTTWWLSRGRTGIMSIGKVAAGRLPEWTHAEVVASSERLADITQEGLLSEVDDLQRWFAGEERRQDRRRKFRRIAKIVAVVIAAVMTAYAAGAGGAIVSAATAVGETGASIAGAAATAFATGLISEAKGRVIDWIGGKELGRDDSIDREMPRAQKMPIEWVLMAGVGLLLLLR